MKPANQVTALVWDQGLFVEQASKLAQTYKKVFYYVPWQTAFPKLNNSWIGRGLDGVEVIDSPFGNHFDEIDLFYFPDVNFGAEQIYLESIGKKVFGARMGEELELCRECTKRWLESKGEPVGQYRIVKGVAALRQFIKSNKGKHWIKINKFRGQMESFSADDYKSVEPRLDELEHSLGAFKTIIEFIVEDDLDDKVEIGIDAWSVDGKQPKSLLSGIEIKDLAYVGIFTEYAKLPKSLTGFSDLVEPLLKRFGYRGFFSSECRIGKDKLGYMIDFCARCPSPPNELYQEFYTNFAEIIWQGSNGIMVEPEPVAKYGAEALIHSPWADTHWQPVDFPNEIRPFVKLRNATKIDGQFYVMPQAVGLPEIGSVSGWGDTMEEAIDHCKENAKHVKGYFLTVQTESFNEANLQIEKAAEFGLKLF